LHNLWNSHEQKEEKLFAVLAKQNVHVPVERMVFEHRQLRGHKKVIEEAIKAASESEVKVSLETDGRMMIGKLRKHIKDENEVIYKIATENFSIDEIRELWGSVK